MVINGKALSATILNSVREENAAHSSVAIVRVVVVQPSPATESYLKIKSQKAKEAGMALDIRRLPESTSTEEVIVELELPGADALLVQLPLPAHIDTKKVLNAIPLDMDADVLSDRAHELFEGSIVGALLPPVVGAVETIFSSAGIEVQDTHAVVVGEGWLVGAPCAIWLRTQGAHVTVVTLESNNWHALKDADIIVSGAGSAGIIKPEHIREGVVLIDAGTSESGGAVVGDADPACAEKAAVFTPVPGGVGPISVAYLFKNVSSLLRQKSLQE